MINKLLLIIITSIMFGCTKNASEFRNFESIQYFTNTQQDRIKYYAEMADKTYQEIGIAGAKGIIQECYDDPSTEDFDCMVFDFTILIIDRGMSKLNKFERDEYLKDSKFLSRATSIEYFSDTDMGDVVVILAKIEGLINSTLQEKHLTQDSIKKTEE